MSDRDVWVLLVYVLLLGAWLGGTAHHWYRQWEARRAVAAMHAVWAAMQRRERVARGERLITWTVPATSDDEAWAQITAMATPASGDGRRTP
jgi:hypothetical protein